MKIERNVDPVCARLDTLIRLQATSLVSSLSSQREKLAFLDKAGLTTSEISSILGISSANASKALYKIRQAAKVERTSDEDA